MPPTRRRMGRSGIARPTRDPRAHSHKGPQWCFLDSSIPVAPVDRNCSRGRETPLRRMTSIAHHAFMSTTGEAGRVPRDIARSAFTAPTGVAP